MLQLLRGRIVGRAYCWDYGPATRRNSTVYCNWRNLKIKQSTQDKVYVVRQMCLRPREGCWFLLWAEREDTISHLSNLTQWSLLFLSIVTHKSRYTNSRLFLFSLEEKRLWFASLQFWFSFHCFYRQSNGVGATTKPVSQYGVGATTKLAYHFWPCQPHVSPHVSLPLLTLPTTY